MNLIKYANTYSINSSSSQQSVTIYPYETFKKVPSTRINFSEQCFKLALKCAGYQQADEFNFLLVGSAHFDTDSNSMSIIVEQFDKGQTQYGANSACLLMPTAPVSNALYIPSRLVHNAADSAANDNLSEFYMNSVKFLLNYFQKFCTSLESFNKIMSICSSIYYVNTTNSTSSLSASFDLVTFANLFEAVRTQPIPIVETSLLRKMQCEKEFYTYPKTGYIADYQRESLLLILESEPNKKNKLLYLGIWISGIPHINHPLTWAACIRYAFSHNVNRPRDMMTNSFLVVLFSNTSKIPEFYLCKSLHDNLEFTLLNGSAKFTCNKLATSENNLMYAELSQVKEGYNFKLFRNSLSQLFTSAHASLYGQHRLLNDFNPNRHSDLINETQNDTLLSNSVSFTSEMNMNDTDLQPRSLSTALIQNKILLIDKPTDNSNNNSTTSSSSSSNGSNSSASSSSLSSYPINFLPQRPQHQQQLNKDLSNSTSAIACIGSYHSVSDISVLSDNENDENGASFFTNSLNASSGIQTMSTQSYYSTTSLETNLKQSNTNSDFEFLRPKDPPPLPQSKPVFTNQSNFYRYSNSSNVNSLSCSSGTSSLSPSPTPSFSNIPQPQNRLNQAAPPQDPYDNSKSMMFGIPRDSPMPTATPSNLDSPFVDVTLNNCDDLSLYQPNLKLTNQHQQTSDIKKPILKKTNENFNKELDNSYLPQQTRPLIQHQQLVSKPVVMKNDSFNSNMNTNLQFNHNQTYAVLPPPPPPQTSQSTKTSSILPINHLMSSSSSPSSSSSSSSSSSNICLSSSSSSSFNSPSPALSKQPTAVSSTASLAQLQPPPQQNNPSFLMSNSLYSSISVSSNASSNNSNHSYNQHQSINLNSSNNTSTLSENNQFNQVKNNQTRFNQPGNYMEKLRSMRPQDIADLLMNNDEKLQSQLIEMNKLKEQMNSLNLMNNNNKQLMINNNNNNNKITPYNNSSERTQISNSISKLALEIEERKNSIKNDLFNSFNSQVSAPSTTPLKQQQPQHQQQIMHSNNNNNNNNNSSNFNSRLDSYRKSSSELTNDLKNHRGELNELEEDLYLKQECANVFGLRNNWSDTSSVSTLGDDNMSIMIQKLNSVSLFLDDICDKNISLNTKALAAKYLNTNSKQKFSNHHVNNNYEMSLAFHAGNSYYANSNNMTLMSSASLPPLDSSKYEYNPNMPLFQFYSEANNTTLNSTSFATKTSDSPSKPFIEAVSLNSVKLNQPKFNSASFSHQSTTANDYSDKKNRNSNSNLNRVNNKEQEESDEDDEDDDDDEEEIWLFGKPSQSSTRAETKPHKSRQQQAQRAQKCNREDKDFSDQDEPDRDVTHVLDIEKLKRLPKLL